MSISISATTTPAAIGYLSTSGASMTPVSTAGQAQTTVSTGTGSTTTSVISSGTAPVGNSGATSAYGSMSASTSTFAVISGSNITAATASACTTPKIVEDRLLNIFKRIYEETGIYTKPSNATPEALSNLLSKYKNLTLSYSSSTTPCTTPCSTPCTTPSSDVVNATKCLQILMDELGFYDRPIYGVYNPEMSKRVNTMQLYYGLPVDAKINADDWNKLISKVCSSNIITKSDTKSLILENKKLDDKQAGVLVRTYNLMVEKMGLTRNQAVGALGNIYAESRFSVTNAQDEYGYDGLYNVNNAIDKYNYTYKVDDAVGWGLLQWTFKSRKQGLLDMAKSMASNVNDINVQLAYFKKEMESTHKTAFNNLKNTTTLSEATKTFLYEIENPLVKNLTERVKFAETINKALFG